MHNSKDTQKVICTRCSGNGIISIATGDSDKCQDEYCPFCLGVGMMIQTVTTEYQVIKKRPELKVNQDSQ